MRHSTRASVGNVVSVPTVTLADAFAQWGPPTFCKIDIEGAEIAVIDAAHDLLRNSTCHFALDTNHLVGGAFTDTRIEDLFRRSGYEATSANKGMKTTWARPAPASAPPFLVTLP
jgi:hypothetical protein